MKKSTIILAAAALVALACTPEGPDYPVPEPGTKYVLEGTVATPGFAWETMSSVGLYSNMTEVKAQNLECKIDGWANTNLVDEETGEKVPYTPSQYEGMATACFNTPEMDLIQGENSFIVYTPYDPEMVFLKGVIYGLEVSDNQTMPTVDMAAACFAYGECKGIPGVDKTFKFELNPACAMAKVSVTSSELAAKGYGLSKVTIYDENGEAALGGAFDVNIEKGEVKTLECYSNVSATVKKTKPMENGKEQSIYIQIMPGDFSATELMLVLEFTGEAGKVTIPVKKSGLSFEVGQTTEIKFEDVKSSDCNIPWFCAEESRLTSGLGYAYGDANTYFIQCKNGKTWNGATYAENSNIPDEVVIDYRARGDFFAAEDPTGATFEWFTLQSGALYAPRTASYAANGTAITNDSFTITPDPSNYTVKVKNVSAFAGAPILLMKKNDKVLWAWTFWNIAADGTEVKAIDVDGFKLANMNIGQPTTNGEKWVLNLNGTKPDPLFRFDHMYQWGRPMPVFWNSYWSIDWYYGDNLPEAKTGNVPAVQGPLSLAQSLEMPVGLILARPDDTNLPHWDSDENRASLWGAPAGGDIAKLTAEEAQGTKSIYDPCPKGWRVADYYALDALNKASKTESRTNGLVGFTTAGSLFLNSGYGNGKTATNGRLATMGGGDTGAVANCGHGVYWSNYLGGNSSNQPRAFYFNITASASSSKMASYNGSISAPVRCQVDEANR